MAISRAAFQIKLPGKIGIGARQVALALQGLGHAAQESERGVQRIDDSIEDRSAAKGPAENDLEIRASTAPNLPPTDAPSAGAQEAIGSPQPQPDTRRGVATGRDAPQFLPVAPEHEGAEMDWSQLHGQTQVVERRIQGQKSAVADQLSGIHDFVERLLELTEGHLLDGGPRLQSLEQKLAQLEMRCGLNRNSP